MVTVPTSAGDVDVESLGAVLMHEHVFVRSEALQWGWPGFGGWDEDAEVAAARERLGQLRQAGVGSILDMTVPGLGRDPALVARAAEGTGVNVMFATGFFTLDCLPFPFQYRGPGKFLDGDAPSRRGLEQQQIFAEHGVDPGRVLIGHCSETTEMDYLERVIDGGSYVGWDRCGMDMDVPLDAQLDTLAELCYRGYASRVMLSHDKASYMDWWTSAEIDKVLPSWQGTYVHAGVLPGLRERGVPEEDIEQIMVRNPRDFFAGTAAERGRP